MTTIKYTIICFSLLVVAATADSQTFRNRLKARREERHAGPESNFDGKAPDYANLFYWAAHPEKLDYSDSIPSFLTGEARDTSVDVFFLHPTTYTKNFQSSNWNADIDDTTLNHQTDISTILYQASVFNGSCRVFAPRYRQAHLKAYFQIESPSAQAAFDMAYEDLKAAFKYYLEHWNHGRPIVIAAHSQGAMHAVRLLQEFFDGKPLQQQLVCAYVVGWRIKKDDFKNIPFGTSGSQTGCVVGWRTYKKGVEDLFVKRENGNSLCVNPISWKTDTTWTPKEMHIGAIGKDFNQLISKRISVAVAPEINVVWVAIPEEVEQNYGLASRIGNFHIADYNLFWMDIRENVKRRIKAYFDNR